jgi:predicted nucleic acid binding AN1-type Zn finger protein
LKFKNYEIKYCGHCRTLIIGCPYCTGTYCNAQSCEKCSADFDKFGEWLKTQDREQIRAALPEEYKDVSLKEEQALREIFGEEPL